MDHYAAPALFGARRILGEIRRTCKIVFRRGRGGATRGMYGDSKEAVAPACPPVITGN